MMNPDAKAGSGKNSRRRTPSVDTSVGGTGGNGGPGGVGGRGPDFKRRGRTKKSNLTAGGLIPGHIRYLFSYKMNEGSISYMYFI